jgi:tRNA (uracil-5-)-methyltransferase TRM9
MNRETALKLNQLNLHFYNTIASEFDSSRQYAWDGWKKVIPYITDIAPNSDLKVLDLGCGNARFGHFLEEALPNQSLKYVGVDSNQFLLEKASQDFNTVKLDLVPSIIDQKLALDLKDHASDVVVAFGLIHHLPGFEYRRSLIDQLKTVVKPGGIVVLSLWKFLDIPRLKDKLVTPEIAGFNATDLENNDFIMSWERGQTAYRYCHYCDDLEIKNWFPTHEWEILDTFSADAKEGNANMYLIAQRRAVLID